MRAASSRQKDGGKKGDGCGKSFCVNIIGLFEGWEYTASLHTGLIYLNY